MCCRRAAAGAFQRRHADEIDWLPSTGWNMLVAETGGADGDVADRMGAFIASTMELHQLYLDRLSSVKDEGLVLDAITGVFDTPLMDFRDAVAPVAALLPGLDRPVDRSHEFGKRRADAASPACPSTRSPPSTSTPASPRSTGRSTPPCAPRTGPGSSPTCRICDCFSQRCRNCRPGPSRCGAVWHWTCVRSTRSDGP